MQVAVNTASAAASTAVPLLSPPLPAVRPKLPSLRVPLESDGKKKIKKIRLVSLRVGTTLI